MSREDSIKIIVAGLPRTGTMSLKAALEQLGFGPCHHLLEPPFQISRVRRSAEVLQTRDPKRREERFRSLYEGYEVVLDVPGSACVDDLVRMYPDVKVILTKRQNSSLWLNSVKGLGIDVSSFWFRILCFWVPGVISSGNMSTAWNDIYRARFGLVDLPSEEMYVEHNNWIRNLVPHKSLLEFEPSMGWEPLCQFLDKKVPVGEPFPRRNDRSYLKNGLRAAGIAGLLSWAILFIVLKYCISMLR